MGITTLMTRLLNYLFSPDHKMRTCLSVIPLSLAIGALFDAVLP